MDARYAVITETQHFGAAAEHSFASPVFESLDEALGAVADHPGPKHLGHNVSSVNESVWEVEREGLSAEDWGTFGGDLEEAVEALFADRGIDTSDGDAVANLDCDWLSEAARSIGRCVVSDDRGNLYLCKPLADA